MKITTTRRIPALVTSDLAADGVVGNPKGADAETGELEIRAMVDQLALALEEVATLEFMS